MMRALLTPAGLKAAALALLGGAGLVMTIYAGIALWIVRERPEKAFYLGLGALVLIGIVITGFAGLLIKRNIKGTLLGNSFEIADGEARP